jgi:Uncharacterised nucleotidyltransferase
MTLYNPLPKVDHQARLAFALLVACVRFRINQQDRDEAKVVIPPGIDWGALLRRARRHRLAPLLYWHLHSACPEEVPPAILNELRHDFRANSARNLLLTREMLRLLKRFEAHEIPVVAFKGPLLGSIVYPNSFLRSFTDLDFLVHKHDFSRIRNLLRSEGYLHEPNLSSSQERALLNYSSERSFIRASNGIELDIHWEIVPRTISHALDSKSLWQHVQHVCLAGTSVPTIAREDLLLFLCVHGSKHLWSRLSWIADVFGLMGAYPPIDWRQTLKLAGAHGCTRMLFLGLILARDIMGAGLPSEICAKIRSDPEVGWLASQIKQWLESDTTGQLGLREIMAFHVRVTERRADKIRYLYRLATVPTMSDIRLWNPPHMPCSTYYVFRQFRLLSQHGRKALALTISNERSLK